MLHAFYDIEFSPAFALESHVFSPSLIDAIPRCSTVLSMIRRTASPGSSLFASAYSVTKWSSIGASAGGTTITTLDSILEFTGCLLSQMPTQADRPGPNSRTRYRANPSAVRSRRPRFRLTQVHHPVLSRAQKHIEVSTGASVVKLLHLLTPERAPAVDRGADADPQVEVVAA